MGTWMYCDSCGEPLDSPYYWSTSSLLIALSNREKDYTVTHVTCPHCGDSYEADLDWIVDELAARIGEGRKKP